MMNTTSVISYTVGIIIIIIYLCCVSSCYYFVFMHQIDPDTIIHGCQGDSCQSKTCTGHDSICLECIGDNCMGGNCIGEFCQAGNCTGTNCKAGDCYGYGCKPGVCTDPDCPTDSCPQINKQCTDGKAKRIIDSKFINKKNTYSTLLNPPLCRNYVTYDDILKGRAKKLKIQNIQFYDVNKDNKLSKVTTTPQLVKNTNCELCVPDGYGSYNCQMYDTVVKEDYNNTYN